MDAAEADAIRFRRTFGLDSSPATAREATDDRVNFSADLFGIPLSQSEVAEMLARAETQWAVRPAFQHARGYSDFAGAYLDQEQGGIPVFMFTEHVVGRAEELATRLPASTAYRIEGANRTYRQLEAVLDDIESDWSSLKRQGVDVVTAGIRTDENLVFIGVNGLATYATDELRSRFGQDLEVFEDSPAHADACNGTFDCRPMKGGIDITRPTGACTSGFVVKRQDTSALHILTAGHCIEVHGGYNAQWSHNSDPFGYARHETWRADFTRDGDVGLITIAVSETPSSKNQVHTESVLVKPVTGWDSVQFVGDQSCRFGRTSKLDCGVINAVDVIRDSETSIGTMSVRHTNQVSYDSTDGDSGGPMFFYASGGSSLIAQGTHVHSATDGTTNAYGWFTPISWGRTAFSSLNGYNYDVCTNSACS
jgi:hypothetical protein